jgi:hypothetical protein
VAAVAVTQVVLVAVQAVIGLVHLLRLHLEQH